MNRQCVRKSRKCQARNTRNFNCPCRPCATPPLFPAPWPERRPFSTTKATQIAVSARAQKTAARPGDELGCESCADPHARRATQLRECGSHCAEVPRG